MKQPKDFHPEARALLVIATGMATPGLSTLLEQYGYQQDDSMPGFWRLEEASGNAGLVFSDDMTEVAIVGDARENVENVNYVLSRGGWAGADLITADSEIEEELLSVLASVEIVDIKQLWKGESAGATLDEELPSRSARPESTPSSAVQTLDESVHELQNALRTVDEQGETIQQLNDEKGRLEERVRSLENQLRDAQKGGGGTLLSADSRLITVVEKYLLQQLNIGVLKESDLVRELGDAGYEIKLSLAKR